tara:strand:- start:4 stop:240 length:237 start_codon:yes stop_codon:yes gene_type:complete
MKKLLIVSLIMFFFVGPVYSYPESKLDDCISRALENPTTKSNTKDSIINYCDCALKRIIDEKKDIRQSGYQCALKNFN